jgi:hypothetical protein
MDVIVVGVVKNVLFSTPIPSNDVNKSLFAEFAKVYIRSF